MLIKEIVSPHRPITEAAEQLLLETQLIEGFLDTAKAYLGAKFTDTVDSIKGGISDITKAAILIKDAISCPGLFDVTSSQVGKNLNSQMKSFNAMVSDIQSKVPAQIAGVVTKFIEFFKGMIAKAYSLTGITQFLAKLGLYGFVKYVNEMLRNPAGAALDTALGTVQDKLQELFTSVLSGLSMGPFMNFFATLKTVKTYFLDLLTAVKSKIDSAPKGFGPKCDTAAVAEQALRHSDRAILNESLDRPYPLGGWRDSEFQHYVTAELPGHGGLLEIDFERRSKNRTEYEINFYRDGKQHVTGDGDEFRIFATVLAAIQQFIARIEKRTGEKPVALYFDALKPNLEVHWDKRPSRANLYTALIKRYAQRLGYKYRELESGAKVTYYLTKMVTENFKDGKGPGKPGDSARHGIPKNATLSQLDKIGQGSGRKAQLARWQANMRRGRRRGLGEVTIDNVKGWGEVPLNRSVDYHGLSVQMRPSVFLKLAAPLSGPGHSEEAIKQHIASGGAIASPFLDIEIPVEWEDHDYRKHARIAGHEGRNRMRAVLAVDGDEPIEVHLIPRGGLRRRHIQPEWIESMISGMYAEGTKTLVTGPVFKFEE